VVTNRPELEGNRDVGHKGEGVISYWLFARGYLLFVGHRGEQDCEER
jgi:hypothetical protein